MYSSRLFYSLRSADVSFDTIIFRMSIIPLLLYITLNIIRLIYYHNQAIIYLSTIKYLQHQSYPAGSDTTWRHFSARTLLRRAVFFCALPPSFFTIACTAEIADTYTSAACQISCHIARHHIININIDMTCHFIVFSNGVL